MNEIVNKFSLTGDKFMDEMHLRHPRFTQSTCGTFTKNKVRIKQSEETRDSRHTYQDELDTVCFQYDMAYEDFPRKTVSDKVLRDKTFNIAKKSEI